MRPMPDAPSAAAGPRPEPFIPQAAPAALEDLRARLRATRWPDAPEDAGWSLGTDVGYLRELIAYWADGFDWPAQEAALARLPRFRVLLGGLGIHFVHARAAAPAGPVLPLVLCHGWPDSFWRYAKVIGLHALLAHRDDRLVDAHVPRERRDPARAARPPGRGAVRLLALPRRHRPPAAGVAGAHGERRARDRTGTRRALRAVRGTRALRRGAARVLPPLPGGGGLRPPRWAVSPGSPGSSTSCPRTIRAA